MKRYNLSRRNFLTILGSTTAAASLPNPLISKKRNSHPNIIFFVVDDMGWMDSSVYGSKFYETPYIDRLAKGGMLFTDAYSASPNGSPTRAALLTGKWPVLLNFNRSIIPGEKQKRVPANKTQTAPYQYEMICPGTADHLRHEEITFAEELREAGYRTAFFGKWHAGGEPYTPEEQGFDINMGGSWYGSAPSYYDPFKNHKIEDFVEGDHLTNRLTEELCAYIYFNKDAPFMLALWHYEVHTPLQADPAIIKKYKDKADLEAGQHNPVYAAMIESIDTSLCQIIHVLEELGLEENTVIIFTSDNGGRRSWLNGSWEHVTSNHPLRGGKGMIYEGGIRVPLIIRWPGVVKPGSRCKVPVSSVDFLPTILDISKTKEDPRHRSNGRSILPLLKKRRNFKKRALYWHFPVYGEGGHGPSAAIRQDDYKLIKFFGSSYELYDLKKDIGETKNLTGKMPDKVKQMSIKLNQWLKKTGAWLPRPNPDYKPEFFRKANSKDKIMSIFEFKNNINEGIWRVTKKAEKYFHINDMINNTASGIVKSGCPNPKPFVYKEGMINTRRFTHAVIRIKCRTIADPKYIKCHILLRSMGWKGDDLMLPITIDGYWHEYTVDLRISVAWRRGAPKIKIGMIFPHDTRKKTGKDVSFALDYIRLIRF